jgi:hypothetical protein
MGIFSQKKSAACMTLAAGILATFGLANAAPPPPTEFDNATIHVERNATDGDTEIFITAKGGDEGLRELRIRTPDKKQIVLVESPKRVLGIREFVLESPEPEASGILAVYPEGAYTFQGVSTTGEKFKSTAQLSHQLPETTVILHPVQDAVVGTDALTIQWSAVAGIAEYVVEFENKSVDPRQILRVNVPTGSTSLAIPPSMLVPGANYQVGVATVSPNGNVVFVETTFSTSAL